MVFFAHDIYNYGNHVNSPV